MGLHLKIEAWSRNGGAGGGGGMKLVDQPGCIYTKASNRYCA